MNTSPYNMLGGLVGSSAAAIVLTVIAVIAAIVATVLAYRRFVSQKSASAFKFKDPNTWGPFIRFENLLIDKILIALYLFSAICLAFVVVALLIASLIAAASSGSAGPTVFFTALITLALVLVVGELLLRLGFELQMLLVLICRNTSELRRTLCPVETSHVDAAPLGVVPPAPFVPADATAPISPVAVAPTSASQDASDDAVPAVANQKWTCPQCGARDNDGGFCGQCGTPKP